MVRILVIDDHRVLAAGVAAILSKQANFSVCYTTSPREALEKVQRGEVRVVLADLGLPGFTGTQFLSKLLEVAKEARIIVLSQDTRTQTVKNCLELGATGYLSKTSDPEVITTAIKAAVRGEVFVDPLVAGPLLTSYRAPDRILSDVEQRILTYVQVGATNKKIAEYLTLSVSTIKTHLVRIYRRLDVNNRTEAVHQAVALGILESSE